MSAVCCQLARSRITWRPLRPQICDRHAWPTPRGALACERELLDAGERWSAASSLSRTTARRFPAQRPHARAAAVCEAQVCAGTAPRAAGAMQKMAPEKRWLSANIAARVDLIGGREQARRA